MDLVAPHAGGHNLLGTADSVPTAGGVRPSSRGVGRLGERGF